MNKKKINFLEKAKRVFQIEAEAILELSRRLDKNFLKAVEWVANCRGRVVLTGMGKAGLIAQKISATLSSLGTPSLWLHPAEALHGDLGRVTSEDVLIALSTSGETEEITKLLPLIKKIGARLIAFTGNLKSHLAQYADVVLDVSVKREACPLGLAPTASTTAILAMGDALAIAVLEKKGFKKEDFALLHPGGTLGKRLLLKVEDIMRRGEENPLVREDVLVKDMLLAITRARAGSATVIDKNKRLVGIFTDGDLRRNIETDPKILERKVKEVMTKSPKTIKKGRLAEEALKILREYKIDEIPVVDEKNRPIGLVDVQDLLKAGIV
ncbi:MAG: KpsF/GutQ family sugar-phosphate isomerase [Candidatus Omnitrophica bacterium]|nr:KpsF/GutQ family sugar-phosphate isomerase [Candidatus Omnitrophota bacterium]MCM8793807.1 KpsF/GutQ family sugar-phosphate isomerase [Candidatus Omnitrophota bacterium]